MENEINTKLLKEIEETEKQAARIEWELRALEKHLARLKTYARGEEPKSFADLRGIWKGADFSWEEIQAAKIKVKQLPE